MQVLLNADPHTDGRHKMAEHLETTIKDALSRFGERISRVEAHLADVNGHAKSSPDEIQCTLEARLVGLDPVVVKDHAGNAHQAIHGAVEKLKRAITTAIEKHDAHRDRTAHGDSTIDPTGKLPD